MSPFTNLFALHMVDGEVLGPVLIALGMFSIPIVGILTRHQRKMAEILHGRPDETVRTELESVKRELADLRSHMLAIDSRTTTPCVDEEVTRRLG